MMRTLVAFSLSVCTAVFGGRGLCLATDVTLVYTGQTHAMLYRCNCPYEPDGGVARRATLIGELRGKKPAMLLVESGGYTAGGLMDEYNQNTDLDMRRSIFNMRSMTLMRYDAVGVGDDEFNFGRKFWEENVAKTKLPFVSANIQSKLVVPWVIRDVAGVKFGITSVAPLYASQKSDGIAVQDPASALTKAVGELKAKGAQIIILLGYLGENEDLKLVREIPGIDILIIGRNVANQENTFKVNQTLVLKPSWQGRRLDVLSLSIEGNAVKQYKLEQLRLSDQVKDDPGVSAFLPQCFTSGNCKKESAVGTCQNPGLATATCAYTQSPRVNVTVITDKSCRICQTEGFLQYLKSQFPGLAAAYLYYPEARAKQMIKQFDVQSLPAYIFGREIEKESSFERFKNSVALKDNSYLVKPQFSGMAYLINRPRIKGALDIMFSLYNKDIPRLLDVTKEFQPVLHFLAIEKAQGFETEHGGLETEEYLRSVCVRKYYPQAFWNYISCRANNMNTSWWEDCLGALDAAKIKTCARSEEGAQLLRDNIALNKAMQVMAGPTYLADNCLIFGSNGVPTKDELKKILSENEAQ